jgi:hypothetical protein
MNVVVGKEWLRVENVSKMCVVVTGEQTGAERRTGM